MNTEAELVKKINDSIDYIDIAFSHVDKCAGQIRPALDCAVKLFWLKKLGKIPVWVNRGAESFELFQAITDERFSKHFSKIVIDDMHTIRKMCNDDLHGKAPLSKEDAEELFVRLERCIRAIEKAIPMKIISDKEVDLPLKPEPEQKPKEPPKQPKQPTMGSSTIVKIGEVLIRNTGHGFGGSAQPIYDACCEKFSWDASKRYLFGPQRLLYAQCATREAYSPWFVAHSNLTETQGGKWKNRIVGNVIEEAWENQVDKINDDQTTRVVFAKTKKIGYVFLGVYKPVRVEKRVMATGRNIDVKIYEKISDAYPKK